MSIIRTVTNSLVALLLVVSMLSAFVNSAHPVLAQEQTFKTLEDAQPGDLSLKSFIGVFYTYLSRFVLIISLLAGIVGGYMYMYSGGDPGKLKSAKEIIYSAVTGIIAVAFAYIFFDILNPGSLDVSK